MSYSSDKVKRWRKRTKKRIIDAMGGGCVICNYSICNSAMDIHHLNPEEKEFGFGKIMANPKKWEILVTELRKCILVCCRCHREIHDGLIQIPNNVVIFDESYTFYREEKKQEECPVCGILKSPYTKTCSYSCAAKLSGKVDWDNVDLEELLIQKKSYESIGRMLDVSGNAVKKRAKKLGLVS